MAGTFERQPFGLTQADIYHTHIEPSRTWLTIDIKEMWLYRELLYFLTWRDIKIRYKQTVLGFA